MNSIKCKNCGLKNFASENECKRCGSPFVSTKKRREKRPRSFSVWSFLLIAGALGLIYYFYSGVQATIDDVDSKESKRIASQPAERPVTPGLSRSQYDKQRSGHYGDAVKTSSSLKAHDERNKATEKMVQQLSNSAK